jgi:hypothetical protein
MLPFSSMRYWPNPAHKEDTTEAGPPAWAPNKEKCPRDITTDERNALFLASIPVDAANPRSRRFAVRRTSAGIEIFDIKFTRDVDDDQEIHGHPASRVDRRVLKAFMDQERITSAEYNRLRKELPGC